MTRNFVKRDNMKGEPPSQFQWKQDKLTGVVVLKDNGIDGRTVSNDASRVLECLRKFMGNKTFDKLPAIIYQDNMANFLGMLYQPSTGKAEFYSVLPAFHTHNSKRQVITIVDEHAAIQKAVALNKGSLMVSKERAAFRDMMNTGPASGHELDLESFNEAVAEGVTRHLEGTLPENPAILADSMTGKARFGSGWARGNEFQLLPFDATTLGELPTVEQIKEGIYKDYAQEMGFEEQLQDIYKEKEREHEAERE
jgi:hypothetical protein